MKKSAIILIVVALHSAAGAGTMIISGLPEQVNTSAGPVYLLFDIVSNGQLDNDSVLVATYEGGMFDIADTNNIIVPDEIYLNGPYCWDPSWSSCVWADIAIVKPLPAVIQGNIITDLALTIAQGFEGTLDVEVLSENWGTIEDVATIEAVTECFPDTAEYATQYADWVALYMPNCWCSDYGDPSAKGNQCYGDANGDAHVFGYVVFTTDLNRMAYSWKAKIGDSRLDPCSDFDHKAHPRGYRVFTGDLAILASKWKRTSLPGDCPLTDAENDAR